MNEKFRGYHSEWNLGSPGGWLYQQMTQQLGRYAWERVQKVTGVSLELDFDEPLLNPIPAFTEVLMQAHRNKHGSNPVHVALAAEEDTLEDVVENRKYVEYLNSLEGVSAVLLAPHWLEKTAAGVGYQGKDVTVVFMDFNSDTLLETHATTPCDGLIEAIRLGILVNPRGMEPINAKGIFEAITGALKDKLHKSTVEHTPWTRQFFQRKTDGPGGEQIADLLEWTRSNKDNLVLKPEHGYSGQGVFVGPLREDWDADISEALDKGDYIVQEFIPLDIWAEDSPWLDREKSELYIHTWQTDFRCFITPRGLAGFVGRFGKVPTNVGSGGGTQSIALLRGSMPPRAAVDAINQAVMSMGYDAVSELREEIDAQAMDLGLKYLLGPIPTLLRPRLITPVHLTQLQEYCTNIWLDCIALEQMWNRGELEYLINITEEQKELARSEPWQGGPALIASDGIFDFGAAVK